MRKALLPIFMLLMCSLAQAQIQKGDVLIGGLVEFNRSSAGDLRFTNLNLEPRAGFFLSDRTSIGPILGYIHNRRKQDNNIFSNDDRTNIFTFGAYMRNYKSIGEKFFFFLQSSITYGSGTRKISNPVDNAEGDQTRFDISVSPGFSYFVTDRLAFDVTLATASYRDEKIDAIGQVGGTANTSRFVFSGGLSNVGLGLSWFLR